MQKHLLYKNLLALTSVFAFVACTDEVVNTVDPDNSVGEKTPIELSVGTTDKAETRAIITDGTNKNLFAFNAGTSLYMVMKSEDLTSGSTKSPLYTRTVGFALKQTDDTKNYSDVSFTASNEGDVFKRYWEDSYSRSSALSIYAVCVPGYAPDVAGGTYDFRTWNVGTGPTFQNIPWGNSTDAEYAKIDWPISTPKQGTQDNYVGYTNEGVSDESTGKFIERFDLCFTNNLANWSQVSGKTDARLKFNSNGDRKFDAGTMIFYHALSKLTFKLKKGAGFSDAEFAFKENTNIKLTNFWNYGTFDMVNGEFKSESLKKKHDIEKIFEHTTLTDAETAAGVKKVLDALVIPGTNMDDATTVGVSFIINGNEYKLSMKQLYDAIVAGVPSGKTIDEYFDGTTGSYNKLKAGIHYVFTLTVGKSKIDKLTAQLVEWETIEAEATPSNATIKLQLEERGNPVTSGIELYRTAETTEGYNWTSGYSKECSELQYATDHWTTSWFWPDNQTYYHLRALDPTTQTVTAVTDGADYTSLSHSETVDVLWGAPFLDDGDNETAGTFKFNYGLTKNGFDGTDVATDHQIYHAIGATSDTIKMLMFHLLSNVNFRVQTTTGDDKVTLVTGEGDAAKYCTITLKNVYTAGTALLSNGLVKESGTRTSEYQFSVKPTKPTDETYWLYNYYAIPQELIDDVVVVITTPDNNQYEVQLNKLKSTAVTDNNLNNPYTKTDGKYTIDRWYPHYQYTYTFTLKKTGITDVQVTILDWEKVEADPEEVEIK